MEIFARFPQFEHSEDIRYLEFPEHIQSLSPDHITSEASALNCAYISGILKDFIGDVQMVPAINGRMSSSQFNFKIQQRFTHELLSLTVDNAQVEIDAGYEGAEY